MLIRAKSSFNTMNSLRYSNKSRFNHPAIVNFRQPSRKQLGLEIGNGLISQICSVMKKAARIYSTSLGKFNTEIQW